jgi:hypothetical protein
VAKSKDNVLRLKTCGYSVTEELAVDPGVCRGGTIKDGVAFWHDRRGAWLVSYADLMMIADAATRARRTSATKRAAVDPQGRSEGKRSTRV